MDFYNLANILRDCPELCSVFGYHALQTYFDLVGLLRPVLETVKPSYQLGPPATLPVNVHEFLKAVFKMSDYMGKLAWAKFAALAWNMPLLDVGELDASIRKHVKLFMDHGLPRQLGVYNFQPPTRVCIDTRCSTQLHADRNSLRDRELKEPSMYPITVFTRDFGAVPGFATSWYCRKCNTRYYPNYYVHTSASIRTYYASLPVFIQSSQHFYVAASLCELFATMMVTSWTSATNCARIYSQGLSDNNIHALLPADWQTSLVLDVEDVWNCFFLHALILEHHESGHSLHLAHNAESQAKRLQPALQARNAKMSGTGQEAWNHACDRCCYIDKDDDGNYYPIRSTITDGITIGRPCCADHDCKKPLPTVKHRYCADHAHLSQVCAVENCEEPIELGFRTCSEPTHRDLEVYQRQQGKAMFQLKHRLERLHVSQTHDSLVSEPDNTLNGSQSNDPDSDSVSDGIEGAGADEDEEILVDEGGICNGKPETGNRSVRARFGRRRTHNEELCVGSCGVILGRATFYGSEAPNGVRTFWMGLFPTRQSLPFVLWHDNNCRIVAMLNSEPDNKPSKHYFDNCALPVDVFHFKSKHKESDEDCGRNCNPYIWPELRTKEGTWRFNSSAAEQTNAWFGGFQAIVREMQADRYDFFLDEMIKRRNRLLICELEKKGAVPYSIPRDELLGPNV